MSCLKSIFTAMKQKLWVFLVCVGICVKVLLSFQKAIKYCIHIVAVWKRTLMGSNIYIYKKLDLLN